MAFTFPATPSVRDEYVSPIGHIYFWTGEYWTTSGIPFSPNPFINSFRYRTIYTRGYMMAGYKDSTPWRNVNRTVHNTDMTANLGDILDRTGSYISSGWSDYYGYVYSLDDTVGGAGTYVGSMSMTTETGRTHSASWDLKTSRTNCGTILNSNLTVGYITGGGSNTTDKHNYITETMLDAGSAGTAPSSGGTGGGLGILFGETRGWISSAVGACGYLTYATETWTSGSISWATDGQPKGLSSKHGWGYGGTGSYAGSSTMQKMNDTTGATITTVTRAGGTNGEENFEIGQNWGYQLGAYNGAAQNNISWKVNYLTDTFTLGGSDMEPKGHAGCSSGGCASAAAKVLGGL